MKNTWYNITDIESFIEATRTLVYVSFGEKTQKNDKELVIDFNQLNSDEQKEINQCLPHQETFTIAKQFLKKFRHKKNNNTLYRISEKGYMSLIESLNARMVSNLLNKLSADGYLDSAYDSELNDFVFWVKDEDSTDKNN